MAGLAVPILYSLKDADMRQLFSDYKRNFSRNYLADEEGRRYAIFRDRVAWINEENLKGYTAVMGLNKFSDLSMEEFKSMYANLRQPSADYAWGGAAYLGQQEIVPGGLLLGDVDWVEKGAVTPVKNQGQCGSCWSFSVTGTLEGRYEIATGTLVSLSEQQFVDCDSSDSGCNGGYPPGTLQWATGREICTESSYPYTARDGSCKASSCTAGIPRGAITGYKSVPSSDEGMANALNGGPVSVAVDANDPFGSYSGGVLNNPCGSSLNHAILAVGYTSAYWKVKNSWGTSWGESGYIRMTRSGNECGILNQASYPVIAGGPGPSPPGPSPPGPSPPGPSPPGPSPDPGDKCQECVDTVSKAFAAGEDGCPAICAELAPMLKLPSSICDPACAIAKMFCSSDGTTCAKMICSALKQCGADTAEIVV